MITPFVRQFHKEKRNISVFLLWRKAHIKVLLLKFRTPTKTVEPVIRALVMFNYRERVFFRFWIHL